MIKELQLRVTPRDGYNEQSIRRYVAREQGWDERTITYDEFIKEAEVILRAHVKSLDVEAVKAILFKELTPMEYLSRKNERPVPENLDDELARYALYFPETMALYEAYIQQPSKFDGIILFLDSNSLTLKTRRHADWRAFLF